jgi:uncharacterized protein (TIGR02265 family)
VSSVVAAVAAKVSLPAPGFFAPDFDRAVDLREYVDLCPPGATTRGTFLTHLCDHVRKEVGPFRSASIHDRVASRRWVPFGSYALTDFMKLAHSAAGLVHPSHPAGEGLRRLGWLAYPSFAATMAGRVVLFALGSRMEDVMESATTAYKVTLPEATVRVLRRASKHYRLELRSVFSFVDTYQVGVLEGAFRAHGIEPSILVRNGDRKCDADLDVRWT